MRQPTFDYVAFLQQGLAILFEANMQAGQEIEGLLVQQFTLQQDGQWGVLKLVV